MVIAASAKTMRVAPAGRSGEGSCSTAKTRAKRHRCHAAITRSRIFEPYGGSAKARVGRFRLSFERLATGVVGVAMRQVCGAWGDGEVVDLYHAMREVAVEYAANMRWREEGGLT